MSIEQELWFGRKRDSSTNLKFEKVADEWRVIRPLHPVSGNKPTSLDKCGPTSSNAVSEGCAESR